MASFPLVFDLAVPKPTTRDIANAVKAGGIAALTEAERRADQARYQEVTCRSALNRVQGMPFNWTLIRYRGCTHGCHSSATGLRGGRKPQGIPVPPSRNRLDSDSEPLEPLT